MKPLSSPIVPLPSLMGLSDIGDLNTLVIGTEGGLLVNEPPETMTAV